MFRVSHYFHFAGNLSFFTSSHFISFSFLSFSIFHFPGDSWTDPGDPWTDPGDPWTDPGGPGRTPGTPWKDGPRGPLGGRTKARLVRLRVLILLSVRLSVLFLLLVRLRVSFLLLVRLRVLCLFLVRLSASLLSALPIGPDFYPKFGQFLAAIRWKRGHFGDAWVARDFPEIAGGRGNPLIA